MWNAHCFIKAALRRSHPSGLPIAGGSILKRVLSFAPLAMTLLASLASAQTVSVSPTPVTLSAMVGSTAAASATVNVSSASGTVAYTIVNNFSTPWLSVGPANATTPSNPPQEFVQQSTPSSFVVFANPTGMAAGTYSLTATITTGVPEPGSLALLGVVAIALAVAQIVRTRRSGSRSIEPHLAS